MAALTSPSCKRCAAALSARLASALASCSRSTQGNRLNDSCGDVGGEGVFVPCGDFASHAQRILVFAGSEHIEGDVLDDGEVEGGVVGTRHSSSRKIMSRTQWRPFSTIQ